MKNTLLLCSMLALTSFSAMASDVLVKSCSTVLSIPQSEQKMETKIDIVNRDGKLVSIVNQNGNSYEDTASVESASVRPGLKGDLDVDLDTLNIAEKLVTHAMALVNDPIMDGAFSAGLDLAVVRSATVYIVGEQGNMGMTAIVEAKDEQGKDLGSYLGGFLVSACK